MSFTELKWLNPQTAGIAAARPTAVATRASAIPGATASIDPPPPARPAKASMIPHTVPNNPTNGVTEPIEARVDKRELLSVQLLHS